MAPIQALIVPKPALVKAVLLFAINRSGLHFARLENGAHRIPLSDAIPRERRELDPGDSCPDCGGDLRVVGEDVSELIDMIAAQLKVIEIARVKKSCRRCERMVQEPAPSRPIPRSMAGPNLLAYVLTSKFDDHVPLYRQNEIFARMGAEIADTTLVDWCGGAMKTLAPLIEKIEAEIMSSDLLHADDTPIRVLDRSRRDKGLGKGVKASCLFTGRSTEAAPSAGAHFHVALVAWEKIPRRDLKINFQRLPEDIQLGGRGIGK